MHSYATEDLRYVISLQKPVKKMQKLKRGFKRGKAPSPNGSKSVVKN
jgi:hypothetical protein